MEIQRHPPFPEPIAADADFSPPPAESFVRKPSMEGLSIGDQLHRAEAFSPGFMHRWDDGQSLFLRLTTKIPTAKIPVHRRTSKSDPEDSIPIYACVLDRNILY
jgi:hypothetical protein